MCLKQSHLTLRKALIDGDVRPANRGEQQRVVGLVRAVAAIEGDPEDGIAVRFFDHVGLPEGTGRTSTPFNVPPARTIGLAQ